MKTKINKNFNQSFAIKALLLCTFWFGQMIAKA